MPDVVAQRAADFTSSIGVCVHLEQTNTPYGDESLVEQEMLYVGVHNARVLAPSSNLAIYQGLAEIGVKFDVVFETTDLAAEMAAAEKIAPDIESIEGINEVDGWPISYDGLTGVAAAVAFQKDLYTAVKADPLLSHAAVLPFSLADNFPTSGSPLSTYGNMSAYANEGNIHAYGSYGVPPYWWVTGVLKTTDTPGLPQIITETGSYTLPDGGSGVDQYVQAAWTVDTLLDAFKAGVAQTYIYQLMDPNGDPAQDNPESHFGLFNTDGTPKLAATALHDLTTILADTGSKASSFTPGSLNYSVAGLPTTWGFTSLLEKSDGQFDIQLWQEPQLWNAQARTEYVITPSTVTVSFAGVMYQVQVFDPLVGTAAVATYSNVSTVTLSLGTDALIVEVTPAGTPTATALAAAPVIPGLTSGTDTGASATDGVTANTCPTLYGSALAGSLVTLFDGSSVLGTAVASSSGLWAFGITTPLSTGQHSITATATTTAGVSPASAPYLVTIENVPPAVAAILSGTAGGSTIHPGQSVSFSLTLSALVMLNTQGGSPTLTLSDGGTATYDAAHSTATSWAFTTTVTGGEAASNLQATALSLNGAIATDLAGNALSAGSLTGVPGSSTGVVVDPTALPVTLGSGLQSIVVDLSEYAWQGDAQAVFTVDGVQVGGTQTVTAINGVASQAFTLEGNFGRGSHTVAVSFVNNLWSGTLAADRKLYVDSITAGGVTQTEGQSLQFNGTLTFNSPVLWTASPIPVTLGSGPDTITVDLSENAWQGDALFTISVDGVQIGGTQTATAEHTAGQTQIYTLDGNFGPGTHLVSVSLLNPAYGGSSLLQRTLYVDRIGASGTSTPVNAALTTPLANTSYVTLPAAPVLPVTLGSGPQSIVVDLSEYAWEGSAQAVFSVDGVQVGGTQTVTAINGVASQAFTLEGNFSRGSHTVAVSFVNNLWGGTLAADRKLYVDSITAGGVTQAEGQSLQFNGTLTYNGPVLWTAPPAPVTLGSGATAIIVDLSENAWQGDAQFTISVDGVPIGGTQTATAEHAAGQTQIYTLDGNFGPGTHLVSVSLLNPAYGGSSLLQRTLYVDSIGASGTSTPVNAALTTTLANTSYVALAAAAVRSVTLGSGPDSITVGLSEDAYLGNAQFTLSVDGVQVGGTQTTTALHASGQSQLFTLDGSFGPGAHVVTVDYLNYTRGAATAAVRNLYVDSVTGSGGSSTPKAELSSDGYSTYAAALLGTGFSGVSLGAGSSSITVNLSEDANQGSARFNLYVDGVQIGGTQTTSALHALGQSQSFTLNGNFGAGLHFVMVGYLNPGSGRNLYLNSVTAGGTTKTVGTELQAGFAAVTATTTAQVSMHTLTTGTWATPAFISAAGAAPLDAGTGKTPLSLAGGIGSTEFILHAGSANGDTIVNFKTASVTPGDFLALTGYGAGATLTQVNATTWAAASASGSIRDLIHMSNGAMLVPANTLFVTS